MEWVKKLDEHTARQFQRSFFNGIKAGIWFGKGMSDKQLIAIQIYIRREEEKLSNG